MTDKDFDTSTVSGRLIYAGKGIADRTGLLANGRTLAIEEKTTRSGRLAKKSVKKKQAEYLDAIARMGHVAILLVEFRLEGRPVRFAVPWEEAPWATIKSAWSLGWEDLEKWAIAPDANGADGESCFLERFCGVRLPRDRRVAAKRRVFARE